MSQQKHEVHDGEILDLVDVVAAADKEEADSRSVYVGNVDYACTAEMVQEHFSTCGTVNRVTILTDKTGKPKGYAYIEFCELHAVQFALQLDESVLYRRHLKVLPKRTNVPGLKQFRTRKFIPPVPKKSPFMSYKRPCFPSNFANRGDARNASRFKKVMRYKPYH